MTDLYEKERTLYREVSSRVERSVPGVEVLALELSGPERMTIFVDHPQGSGCDQQRYGTVCLAAGQGKQGDLCGDGAGDCAEGFVCVVGQRAGKRCAAWSCRAQPLRS